MEPFSRTQLLLGKDAMEKLNNATVAVFGLGGVGGYTVEALARSGVGALELIDHDTISITNINRQILATHSTVGMDKAEAAKNRVLDINPEIKVTPRKEFFGPDTAGNFDFSKYDYVVDAIDTVTGKLALVQAAQAANTPILCCLGTGNKLDASRFCVTDLSKTSGCPLARVMRRELKARGIGHLKVVYSIEEAKKPISLTKEEGTRIPPASLPFVPPVAGLLMAGEIIRTLANKE